MYSRKGKIPKKLLHTVIIVCVAVICLTSIGMTAAKFVSESSADAAASVALFSPSLTSDNNIDISDIKKPGDSTQKTFQIRNYTEEDLSDVAMKYKIVLNTTGNLPLIFTVLDGDGNALAVWDCDGNGGDREYEYESPLVFSPGVAQTHEYTIRTQWQADRNGAQFSGMTDAVYVSVEWEQID